MRAIEQRRRAVVTGMGVVSTNGNDLDSLWKAVREGASGAAPLSRFDVGNAPTSIAAEVSDFDAGRYMDQKTARRLDRSLQYSVAAAGLALRDSGCNLRDFDLGRVGVVEGTSLSNVESAFKSDELFRRKGYRGIGPTSLINGHFGGGSGEVAMALNCRGIAFSCGSGSASGNDAVGHALRIIQDDQADLMLAGGAEAPLLPQIWGVFCNSRVMTRRNEDPKRAMRPFDRYRDGFLLGEGGAFLVLEELTHALGRGARIYGEIAGYGRYSEAFHPVAPEPNGLGIENCMDRALRDSGLERSEIDYINAHGTATETNDLAESRAIKRLFGGSASRVSVGSTKPVTGHLLAASGALESVICMLSIHRQEIPPTINLTEPDRECDLDFVTGGARPYPVRATLNLSSGFGGKNACVVAAQYPRVR